MDRVIFVVRSDRWELYDALRKAFWREGDVEVVLDRRTLPSRRERELSHRPDRRRFDRRVRLRNDAELKERGWTLVRISRQG